MTNNGRSARGKSSLAAQIHSLIQTGAIKTPCLVVDLDELDRVLGLIQTHVPFVELFYAVKANNAPQVISHFHRRGLGFDVASAAEAEEVSRLGVPASRLILANTVHPRSTISVIFDRSVPLITVDTEYGIRAIASEASRQAKAPPRVLVRIRVPSTNTQIDLNTKFGCGIDQAVNHFDLARELGLVVAGVHFHVGTQCWDVETFRHASELAREALTKAKLRGHIAKVIDIGGGMPDQLGAEPAGGLECFFGSLGDVLRPLHELGFQLFAEPGRALVSGACTAVCEVVGKTTREGRDWLYLDDGVYGMFSAIYFEKRKFEFSPLCPRGESPAAYVLAGPTCDSIDTLGEFQLGGKVEVGDFLIARDVGAYSVSVKCHFNGFAHINTYAIGGCA